MEFNNKTVLIIGLVIGGLFSIYANQYEIGSAIFGGLVGYLSKDYVELKDDESAQIMDTTLKIHDETLDKHEDKLDSIQRDLTDLKVRLGIKDKTNGQVIEYQKQLVDAQNLERAERKEEISQLREEYDKLDARTWYILSGVVLSILLEIGFMLMKGG